MDGVKAFVAVIGLHHQLRAAKSVRADDAHKTCGLIDDFVTTLVRGHATWVAAGCELERRP